MYLLSAEVATVMKTDSIALQWEGQTNCKNISLNINRKPWSPNLLCIKDMLLSCLF
jgi:hypothetical protein